MLSKSTCGAMVASVFILTATSLQAQEPAANPQPGEKSTVTNLAQKPEQDAASLMAQSRQALEEGNWVKFYVANKKLSNLRPYDPEYMINIVRACGRLNRASTAYHQMMIMQQQGLSHDFNSTDDTLSIRNTEAYEYLNDMLVEAGQPAGDGAQAFALDGNPSDFAAIAWDGGRNRFLVGTVSEGKLLAVGEDGSVDILLQANNENGLWSINGLHVDEENDRLWMSTAATPRFAGFEPTDRNRGSVLEYRLGTLELINRYNQPVDALPHDLGSLAVSADGHVYVIDRAAPIVYRIEPGKSKLEPFVGNPDLVLLTDIAVTPDNTRLFISDIIMGIQVIDPAAKQSAMLAGPENLNLGGIGAIEYADGELFVVQGALSPQRLMRLDLDSSGSNVLEVSPMAIALEEFDFPAFGTIRKDELFYFANSGAGDRASAAIVMHTPLTAGGNIEPVDMRQFKKTMQKKTQEAQKNQQ